MATADRSTVDGGLPFVDSYSVIVSAPAPVVWRSLARWFARQRRIAGAYASLVAADPRRASGQLFDEGARVPGFEVTEAEPERWVRLTGRHLFSRYALIFTVTPSPDGTLLSAQTYAEFPGPHGWVYRGAVIGSGGHRALVGRMLRTIRDRAEA
jgi:Polyketide cyclase / dehydrase and lipid transport